ncbi:hypothetical protein F8388_026768 [Cannabis sativa]|uniref:Uncharacterized protein n=1 Tax=Cannabis sativa TaxID=3483 RepID=A0A7J6H3P8_CANSA|nr:hypothetical protein F8388_026768 [Cannabis sativa]
MCSSDSKVTVGVSMAPPTVPKFNGRPVLQPTCNRVPTLERRNSVKKITTTTTPSSLTLPPPSPNYFSSSSLTSPRINTTNSNNTLKPVANHNSLTPPISPKSKSPRPTAIKRCNDLNTSSDKVVIPGSVGKASAAKVLERKKSKSFKIVSNGGNGDVFNCSNNSPPSLAESSLSYSSSLITDSPGSIAAGRREQMALQHAQRKMKIAHYGRSKSAKFERNLIDSNPLDSTIPYTLLIMMKNGESQMLFELVVLSGAQVGSDWTSILKKREEFRNAFSGFDAESIATLTDKQMASICSQYGIDISRIKKEFGSFAKYIWGFVNHKPISTQYKSGQRIPVKTSKSETISKDMVRRGFRFVGPTVVHSFMQAAGLTNDHLITCHRHLQCTLLGARGSAAPSAAVPKTNDL